MKKRGLSLGCPAEGLQTREGIKKKGDEAGVNRSRWSTGNAGQTQEGVLRSKRKNLGGRLEVDKATKFFFGIGDHLWE